MVFRMIIQRIKSLIVQQFGKGITVIKGERGYLPHAFHEKTDCDIIITVVTFKAAEKSKYYHPDGTFKYEETQGKYEDIW